MEVSDQIKLKFHGVDFPVINLNSDQAFIRSEDNKIHIDITPKVFYPDDHPEYFKIIQEVRLVSEHYFDLFLLAVGTFEMKPDIDEKTKKHFVSFNAPAIMFPYIRAFVSTLTTNLGNVTGSIIIPTQFFKGELEEITNINQE